ncbi:MAG TPA: hypothetical protein VHX17_13800 [Candidatus Cybelea sp.]|nr:hypothetical protein [Candidatus Cybelea sp.]
MAAGIALPPLPGLAWRNVGPAVAGGRTSGVAGSDRDPYLYYFGGADGGVWKTTDGGLRWSAAWPQDAPGAIGALAIDPHDDQTVWAGTGEPNLRNDISYGDGIWRTRDGGAHWRNAGLRRTWAISRIAIDPRNPQRVLVAAIGNPYRDDSARGVYRTTDGGRSWQRTLYLGPSSGASDIAIDPLDPNVVFAGVWQFRRLPWNFRSGGPLDGLFKSVDGGKTWHRLRGHGLPSGEMGRIGVAVLGNRVYALIQSKHGVLWRSDDGGSHWRLMTADTLVNQRPFYMSRLEIDPRDRNRVFFSSEDLIETRDGGVTYDDVRGAVHQDHHGLWISRDGKRIIEANDGGAPISIDGGKTWDWRFNVVLAQIYRVGYDDENPYHVCGGIQDNDSYCGPSDSLSPLGIENSDWRAVGNDGDGSWVWPQPGDPNSIWNVGVSQLNGQLGIFDLPSRQNYDISPDVTDTNGRALEGLPFRSNWEAPIAFSPIDHRAFYGANVLFETRDRGRSWKPISGDLTRNDPSKQQVAGGPINTDASGAEFYDTIFDIAPSPLQTARIWVGTDDGLVQLTTDGGAHWTDVTPPGIAPWGRIDTVEASHASAQRAYVAIDRHVMGDPRPYVLVTDDSGVSWRTIVAGLPLDQYVHVVREDPQNPDLLYAGLEQGVWVSLDRGAHWESLRLNMPSVAVHDMRVQPRRHDLLVATHGRGFWILDDTTAMAGLRSAVAGGAPQLFAPPIAYTWYRWWTSYYGTQPDECCLSAGAYSGEDPPDGATITYYLPSAVRASVEVFDAGGRLVRSLDAPSLAGVDRTSWDLDEEPPVPWNGARDWNRGGSGAAVVPGRYTVRLRAGTQAFDAPLDVEPDPRAVWTQADYVARYRFVRGLNDMLSSIDRALNRFGDVAAIRSLFTSGVVNSEDDLLKPDRLRERLTILQGVIALSQGPPTQAQQREAAAVCAQFESAMTSYRAFLEARHQQLEPGEASCGR